jgi:3'-phosphoadenosine 5'-phosphosulfate sulfotransferase (PAPS reductase)/FAD synthetase
MAALLDERVTLCFQNTGREHPRTYDFVRDLEVGLDRPIVWLEFRKPARSDAPPKEFDFAVVNYETADRTGKPFREMLEALADYRAAKGMDPVAPWARSRICTAYLKHRVMEKYINSLGVENHDWFVGLRADEPDRVHRIKARDTRRRTFRNPLFDAGITKADVLSFWQRQEFNLNIGEHQGNCTGCFLKDQSDISRVLGEAETDADWWESLERDFKDFGGRNFPGYVQLRKERPVRLAIEDSLRRQVTPISDGTLDARRFHLVMLQEKRRLAGALTSFSCACESSLPRDDDDE